jgi:pimeloyl-ACP methyl ester carboxylesterase/DNA-binding CsgD family transcriptional regulator
VSLDIRFCRTSEGARIAYGMVGVGPALIFPAWWFNHLEVLWAHAPARAFFEALAERCTVVLYDPHGAGLSDRDRRDFTLDASVRVLEAVIGTLPAGPLALFGFSGGGRPAIVYAVRHPERVGHLILYGAGPVGGVRPADDQRMGAETDRAVAHLIRAHWGLGSKALMDHYFPGADPPTREWLAELMRASADGETALRLTAVSGDVRDLLPRVRTPTLVLHRRGDTLARIEQGRALAAGIPGARFVALDGQLHPFFIGDTDAILRETLAFLETPSGVGDAWRRAAPVGRGHLSVVSCGAGCVADRVGCAEELTQREAEVLRLVAHGLTDAEVADRLVLSRRTVQAHLRAIYGKLAVANRSAATRWALEHRLA